MHSVLFYSPGQAATVWFEVLDGYGARADGYANPIISRIILPSLGNASGYPATMTKHSTGLYYYGFTLPTGSSAIGTYIVDIAYTDPEDSATKNTFIQVVVNAVAGKYFAGTS